MWVTVPFVHVKMAGTRNAMTKRRLKMLPTLRYYYRCEEI